MIRYILLLLIPTFLFGQDFTYNGYVKSLSDVGVAGIKAQLFTKRTSAYEISYPTYTGQNTGGTVIPSSDDATHGPFNIGFPFMFFGSAPLNNCLNFDGTNDYVDIPKTFDSDFTIEYWMKTTQTGGSGQWYNGQGIVDAELPGGRNDFGTSLVGSKLGFGIGNPDITITSTSNVNTGNWVHVAATWKRSTGEMKLYINGTLEATGTSGTGARDQSTNMRIGSLLTGIQYFNGSVDEVRIWNVVRTQAEILGSKNTEIDAQTGLIQYYKFNHGTASGTNTGITTLSDFSGNAKSGTLYNFALTGATSNWIYYDATNTYTQFYVGSNGWIGFSAGQTTGYVAQFIPNAGSPKNAILADWEDLYPGSANIYYQTIGTAPNRKLVVSFNAVPHYGCRSNLHSFQFVLYETSNVIDINITSKPLCGSTNATEGLINSAGTTVVPVDGRNASPWSVLVAETKRFTPDAPDVDWVLKSTKYTTSAGLYNFSGLGLDINNYTFKIDVSAPLGSSTQFTSTDASEVADIIIGKTAIQSKFYYIWDVNSDGVITISDLYNCYAKSNGLTNTFNGTPKLFTQTEGTTIKSGTTNLISTLPGLTTYTITTPANNGTSTIYITVPGYSNPSSLTYTY